MTVDRKQPQYKLKICQGRSLNQNTGQQNFTPRNKFFNRGRNQGVIEEITTIGTIIDQIIEIDLEADGITIGQVIEVVMVR